MGSSPGRTNKPTKTCQRCGRLITWRKKWERVWDEVRYCSTACRKARLTSLDQFDSAASLKTLALSAGLDYGKADCEVDNRDSCGEIYAAALGLMLWDANFSGSLSYGHPLKRIGDDIGDEDIYRLDLRWQL